MLHLVHLCFLNYYYDGELAMELAAEFAIEMRVLKKRLGVTCEPGVGGGQKVPKAPPPRSTPASAVHEELAFLPPLLCVLQRTE